MTPTEFKAMRDRLGMTQKQLAESIGVSWSTIARIECGIRPISELTILKLQRAFGKEVINERV